MKTLSRGMAVLALSGALLVAAQPIAEAFSA